MKHTFTPSPIYAFSAPVRRKIKLHLRTIILTALILSIASPVQGADTCPVCNCDSEGGVQKDLFITAYYSPQPGQDHYALGSYQLDVMFNGQGTNGADGTPVYPGMIAAPQEIPFGTIVEIPSLGIVGTVHDRGGRIIEDEDGTIRIDLWMGAGEEGLARALEFGTFSTKGTLHLPQPTELVDSMDLTKFPAPATALANLPSSPLALLNVKKNPQFGDTSSDVAALQHALKQLGYLDAEVNGTFGNATLEALRAFQRDMKIEKFGETADEPTRLALVAQRLTDAELGRPLPEEESLYLGASGKTTRVAQRVLKLLGQYEGDIDGIFDAEMMQKVYGFQKDRTIVADIMDQGAGVIGPQTRRAILTAWRDERIEKRGGAAVVAKQGKADVVVMR